MLHRVRTKLDVDGRARRAGGARLLERGRRRGRRPRPDRRAAARLGDAGRRARRHRWPSRRSPGAGTSTGSARPGRPYAGPTTRPSPWRWTPSTCSRAATTGPRSTASRATGSASCRSPTRPLLDMNVLEWSRHFRCFPGQGVARRRRRRRRDPRGGLPRSASRSRCSATSSARPTRRSPRATRCARCVFLEDQLGRRVRPGGAAVPAAPGAGSDRPRLPRGRRPARRRTPCPACSTGLGFAAAGRHRTKPVTWWRNGDAARRGQRTARTDGPHPRPPSASRRHRVGDVAARAKALLWPEVDRTRGADEALLPGITSPSGLHVFVSADPGERRPLAGRLRGGRGRRPAARAGSASTTSGSPYPPDRLNEEVGFLRTLFDLVPGAVEEFMEPHGRLRSRALRPPAGDLRAWCSTSRTSAPATDRDRDQPGRVRLRRRARRASGASATAGSR